jgi:hypothetical protein
MLKSKTLAFLSFFLDTTRAEKDIVEADFQTESCLSHWSNNTESKLSSFIEGLIDYPQKKKVPSHTMGYLSHI